MRKAEVPSASQLRNDKRPGKFKTGTSRKTWDSLGDGSFRTDHKILSIWSQSFHEILENFGSRIRYMEAQRKYGVQTEKEEINNLGLKLQQEQRKKARLEYDKDKHAALRDSWKENLLEKLGEYGIEDMAVRTLFVEIDSQALKQKLNEFLAENNTAGELWPNRMDYLENTDSFIAQFYTNKLGTEIEKERWDKLAVNKKLVEKGFNKMTLDCQVLCPKKDFVINEKDRVYMVDWSQDDIHARRSLNWVVDAVKTGESWKDENGTSFLGSKNFRLRGGENLVTSSVE